MPPILVIISLSLMRCPSTTDTYRLTQTQEKSYFSVPLLKMDLCLFGKDHGISPAEVASAAGLRPDEVERIYANIDAKRRAATYLHQPPLLVSTELGRRPEGTVCNWNVTGKTCNQPAIS